MNLNLVKKGWGILELLGQTEVRVAGPTAPREEGFRGTCIFLSNREIPRVLDKIKDI